MTFYLIFGSVQIHLAAISQASCGLQREHCLTLELLA
jgi:hypothetical protein